MSKSQTPMSKFMASTGGSFVAGFLPFLALGGFVAVGRTGAGLLVALALMAALVAYRVARRNVKSIEVVLCGWLAVMAGAHYGGWTWGLVHSESLLHGSLAALAWISLAAGHPFTVDFARDGWSPGLWEDRRFLAVNRLITGVWGAVFLLALATSALALPRAPWLAAMALAVVLSVWGPKFIVRWFIGRQLRKANPHDWAMPAMTGDSGEDYDAIVVGAGIGGLTAAALMAKEGGLRVGVFEQYVRPGGFCHSWPRKTVVGGKALTFHFDAGVHDVSGAHPGGTVDSVLGRLGARDRIRWLHMQQEYVFSNLRLKPPRDADDFARLLGDLFPAERDRVRDLFAAIRRVYDGLFQGVGETAGVPRPPRTVDEVLAYPERHPEMVRWQDRSFNDLLDHYLDDEKLKDILRSLTAYLTDRPEHLSVAAMAPIFGYYFHGGYYPEGGSQKLADVLVKVIREQGGKVALGKGVERILVEDGAAKGVRLLNGDVFRAPVVISNADLGRTLDGLLEPGTLPETYRKAHARPDASTSAFSVQLGVDFIPDMAPLTFCREEDGLGVAISILSLADPTRAPQGHACIELLAFVPSEQAGEWDRSAADYEDKKRRMGDRLIARAEKIVPGLSEHIVFREDSSPATFERYVWTEKGSIYGPALNARRPPMKTPVRGLMLAGSGVFPGAGVEAVVISGALAAEAVIEGAAGGEGGG